MTTDTDSEFIVQNSFVGDDGRPANQFFGGISTGSGAPLWVNLVDDARLFPDLQRAQEWCERCPKKAGHLYMVVPAQAAVETATIRTGRYTR